MGQELAEVAQGRADGEGWREAPFDSKEPLCSLALHAQACPALPALSCPSAYCPVQMPTAGTPPQALSKVQLRSSLSVRICGLE